MLTPDQSRVLDQLLAPLDRINSAVRIGFFTRRMADRNMLIDFLARPAGSRRVRTPEHRKVLCMRLDTLSTPEGVQPWQYLTLSIIESLTEIALPNERIMLNELRNEVNRLIRLVRRDPAAAEQPALTFARHFQTAIPKLILNTVSLTNSVFLVILNQVDEVEPAASGQWMEASQYFCNIPGCTVLLAADENELVDKLNRSAEGADGAAIIKQWLTKRVDFGSAVAAARAADLAPARAAERVATAAGVSDVKPGQHGDVPATSARIIRDTLQPDTAAIEKAMAQWHAAMHSVIRRAEQGLGGSISATLVAKLVSLRALAPTLYDSARYDAQMLVALERASKGDESSDVYAEWASQTAQHPKLPVLFAMEPSFTNFDLRDLATALRLTNADDVLSATGLDTGSLRAPSGANQAQGNGKATNASATRRRSTARNVDSSVTLTPALLTTGLSAALVFLADRIVKLLIQSLPAGPSGSLISPEYLNANAASGNMWGGGIGVGAELFGLALAVLIVIFWGDARRYSGHAISLGLMIGALASNLFDRLAYGSILNFVHLANLPVFNLSHVALVVGALMLAWSLLRGPDRQEQL
jgi:lipoprotein signal peptidase